MILGILGLLLLFVAFVVPMMIIFFLMIFSTKDMQGFLYFLNQNQKRK